MARRLVVFTVESGVTSLLVLSDWMQRNGPGCTQLLCVNTWLALSVCVCV